VSGENLPRLPGPGEGRDREAAGSPPGPLPASRYDELAAMTADRVMRGHARRLAADLAEDLLQQTWYTIAQAMARGAGIRNLRAYWYQVMVHTAGRMRQDIARQGFPVGDPEAAAERHGHREQAGASAEDEALRRLLDAGRNALLRARRVELWHAIPATSPDPSRYRDVIWGLAEWILAGAGPETRGELNAALRDAYPEWFAEPGIADGARYQRARRGREDVARLLMAVTGL
jgi:DNA-directed RNA polymerase specialized sigma24 family protein